MHSLAVVCMLLESELLGICIVYEHVCVTCKLISYMHRALILQEEKLLALLLNDFAAIVCIVLSIANCDTID